MKTRLLLFLLLCGFVAKAQTIEVSGLQSGIWGADTILVTNNVSVQDSLCILAGTTVLFDDFYTISVRDGATLKALGAENDSIVFTVADTTGFHLFNMGRGGWNGIKMDWAGYCQFDYCRFQYGKAALNKDQDGGALRIFDCDSVKITHSKLYCNFSREHGGALNAVNSKVVMHDCDVSHNLLRSEIDTIYFMYGTGLRFLKCDVDITTTNFRYNYSETSIGGAMSLDSCTVRIDRCRFEHNVGINGGGLYLIRCYDNPCSITNSLFANNISVHFAGGLAISDSSPLLANLTVVNNHSIGVNCGGIFFYQYSSPVLWNCIVYGNTNAAQIEEPVQMWSWTYDEEAPQFHNCLVQYGLDNISNHDIITIYENCIDEDPLFVDLQNENFHLCIESPCINAGSPDTPASILDGLDLDGFGRVNDGLIDLGAYEYDLDGIHESTQNAKNIHIVGNPITASSYAEIEIDNSSPMRVSLYSLDGKLMVCKNAGASQKGYNRIELGEMFQPLSSGTYLLVVQTNGKTYTAKAVKP